MFMSHGRTVLFKAIPLNDQIFFLLQCLYAPSYSSPTAIHGTNTSSAIDTGYEFENLLQKENNDIRINKISTIHWRLPFHNLPLSPLT